MGADRAPVIARRSPEEGLQPYLRAIRTRLPMVLAVIFTALIASLLLASKHPPTYEAGAKLFINPWPQSDTSLLDIGLLRETGDPTRTMETAVGLIDSHAAASRTAQRLGNGWTRERVEDSIKIDVRGESNILEVIASAPSAQAAADLANAHAEAVLALRRAAVRREVAAAMAQTEARLRSPNAPTGDAAIRLGERLTDLQSIRDRDPTILLADRAEPPAAAIGLPKSLIVALSLMAAVLIAVGAALVLEIVDPRMQDEEDVVGVYQLPVLAAIPGLSRRERRRLLESPLEPIPRTREDFRTIQVQLDRDDVEHPVVMFTSASRHDGKTTTALQFALSLAAESHRVILFDLDLPSPELTSRLGLANVARDPSEQASVPLDLDDLMVPTALPTLFVVPTRGTGDPVVAGALLRHVPSLIFSAAGQADYVVIDTPPLGEVSDALRIVANVDQVLLVARLRNTNRKQLELTRDLLERSMVWPHGLVILGSRDSRRRRLGGPRRRYDETVVPEPTTGSTAA